MFRMALKSPSCLENSKDIHPQLLGNVNFVLGILSYLKALPDFIAAGMTKEVIIKSCAT